jgi:hypothetical protein
MRAYRHRLNRGIICRVCSRALSAVRRACHIDKGCAQNAARGDIAAAALAWRGARRNAERCGNLWTLIGARRSNR